MTDSSAENPALPVVSSEPRASEPSGAAARPPTEPKTYRNRFLAVYAVLGLTLVGAIVGAVVLILQNGPLAAPAWSSWKPASGSTAKMTSAIADHVARRYKLNGRGSQLVAVVAGAPKVTSGTKDVKISAIAVRKPKPQATPASRSSRRTRRGRTSSAASAPRARSRPARRAPRAAGWCGARRSKSPSTPSSSCRRSTRSSPSCRRRPGRRRRRSSTCRRATSGTALAAVEQDADAAPATTADQSRHLRDRDDRPSHLAGGLLVPAHAAGTAARR